MNDPQRTNFRDKDEKPVKEPEKGKKADEPKDKADSGKEVSNDGVGVQPPEARKMARDFLKDVHADDFDAYFDAAGDDDEPLNNAINILRDTEQEDLANDLEDIASDFAELEDDAQEKLDDFKDRLKGKRPAVPEAIKKHNVVHDLYKNQKHSKTDFSAFMNDTKNHLFSLSKVLEAGSKTGHPDEPMAPRGLRQDQIAAVQDSMETLKDQLIDMGMDNDSVMDDIEFVTDPNADHDGYTKGGKVQGAIDDITVRFLSPKKGDPTFKAYQDASAKFTTATDKVKAKYGLDFAGGKSLGDFSKAKQKQFMKDLDKAVGATTKESYNPATKFEEVRLRVEQENEKENGELDIDDVANQSTKKKIKLDKKKTEIKIDPDVDIGQISGGIQTGTGNLH